jgi:transketolase
VAESGGSAALHHKAEQTRLLALRALYESGGGHFGGTLSEIDILTVLYERILTVDPRRPHWQGRDIFILSKGHGAFGLSAVLCRRGYFGADLLMRAKTLDAELGWHTTAKIPGIDFPTGSLGHGLPVAVGTALGFRLTGNKARVFVLLGDGECNEGSIWEAALAAAKYELDKLTVVIDRNRFSMDGPTEEILPLDPLADKWRAFGWAVEEVDGHDIDALTAIFRLLPFSPGRPSLVIADTVKGKGVSFMEGKADWHSKAMTASELEAVLKEFKARGVTEV